jgi:hypothetical protein
MQDLLGENIPEITTPEEADAELMRAWAAFANTWLLKPEATEPEYRTQFFLMLEQKARAMMNLRPVTLAGIKAKLILALCCGPDAGVFCRHYCEGKPLPKLLTFRDRNMSQVYDAVQALDRLLAAERERT